MEFDDARFRDPEGRPLNAALGQVMALVSTICANNCGHEDAARPSVAWVSATPYRVFLNLPETLHRQMTERARDTLQNTSALYETALSAYACNLACGVRLPLSVASSGVAGTYVQLSAERRRWLRRLGSRLSVSESDIVAAAADWFLAGGAFPVPTVVFDRSQQPLSIHDPPG